MGKVTLLVGLIAGFVAGLGTDQALGAEEIGSVSTRFKVLGPNDKIVVEVFDDEEVPGVACYLSRAKTGGIKGGPGLAEDKAEASIACRQTGAIPDPICEADQAAGRDVQ